ncbi:hypothetical protein [Streptomyces scopuliridis]|uniref:hypothetical protein n=1 Tax=Streptomyces scopuliridis TaxID=452529 RepID=UPI0036BA0D44
MNVDWDPAISRAISANVGHPPPFSVDETQSVSSLTVRHAKSCGGLEDLCGLRILLLVGCGFPDLPPIGSLADLRNFTISESALRNLEGVGEAESLRSLELPRNFIEDLTPLLECRQLDSVNVSGNPLSEKSVQEVIPELTGKGVRVIFPTLKERELMSRMRDAGLPFSYYQMSGSFRLCRPGLDLTDMPEADHIKIAPDEVERLLGDDLEALENIFDRKDLIPTLLDP